jgi:TnpA family transposase
VFSAAERESAYVIDGLMRNDVVKSDIHFTDAHGFSEAIFAVTHLLGVSFAPRIKNLKKQNLYMFRSHRGGDRAGWAIKPEQYVDPDSIINAWDDVLRLVATIRLKESCIGHLPTVEFLLQAAQPLYRSQVVRPDHQVHVHPAVH